MKSPWIIFLSCMLFVVIAGCSGSSDGKKTIKGMHTVTYEVSTSTQDVSIIFLDENDKTVSIPQKDTHTNKWTYSFEAKDGAHLSLSAQLLGEGYDTVYVTIYVDELLEVTEPSYGVGVSATTKYDIPMTD
jgi:hypothetical protein